MRTTRKPIDEETFQQMVEQQVELIKKEREREKERMAELMREVTMLIFQVVITWLMLIFHHTVTSSKPPHSSIKVAKV